MGKPWLPLHPYCLRGTLHQRLPLSRRIIRVCIGGRAGRAGRVSRDVAAALPLRNSLRAHSGHTSKPLVLLPAWYLIV